MEGSPEIGHSFAERDDRVVHEAKPHQKAKVRHGGHELHNPHCRKGKHEQSTDGERDVRSAKALMQLGKPRGEVTIAA